MQGFFYVRKVQFKKAGPLPTLGFATSQEAFVEASFLPEGQRKISHTCQETCEREYRVMRTEIIELLSGSDQKKTTGSRSLDK